MSHPRLERRYSAEHIRQQPEYKFFTAGDCGPYTRIAINVENRPNEKYRNQIQRRASVGNFVNSQSSSIGNKLPPRPKTAFRTAAKVDSGINILQKVDRKFSSVSVITRPKTADGFRRKIVSSDISDDACGNETKRMSADVSCSSRSACSSPAGSASRDRLLASECSKAAHSCKSAYDAKLEKSTTFLYGKDKAFSRASQYLSRTGPGVRDLQLHYTETNTAQNDGVIFADLLRIASYRNHIVGESVYGLERRLYTKRKDPHKATTFFDKRADAFTIPQQRQRPRTVAQKSKERKEKIKQKNEEIKFGYVPTSRSMKMAGPDEIEELRRNCRYLRIDPKLQKHLYPTDVIATSLSDVTSQRHRHCKIAFNIPSNDQYCSSVNSVISDDGKNSSSVDDQITYSDLEQNNESYMSRTERYPTEVNLDISANEHYSKHVYTELSGNCNNRDASCHRCSLVSFSTEADGDDDDEDCDDVFKDDT